MGGADMVSSGGDGEGKRRTMSDLLIVEGTVIDGTGAPGRKADIRVRGGRIVEVAPGLAPQGERVIDAAGALVAPGFIDSHTHFDATIYWDPLCDPMPQHGVTSVVVGNCSLGLAPVRPADRRSQVDVYSYIEDMPVDVLNEAIPWTWQGFADYAATLATRKLGVNVCAFVGHSQIRGYVMGEAAWERAATADEVAAMCAELETALTAGALGLSYSLYDKDREGRPVPSCLADDAEMDALCAVLGRHGASFQFVPGDTTDVIIGQIEWLAKFLGPHGVTGFYNILVHLDSDPERSRRLVACLEGLQARGLRIYGMASPRPFELLIGFEQSICFIGVPAWNELVQAPRAEKQRLIRDAGWRARARHDAASCSSVLFPFARPELLPIASVGRPEWQVWIGRTFADVIAARGGDPADVLADWLADNDFAATFTFAIANTDEAEVARLLTSPVAFVSGSDAGAHLQMFCAAGDATLLLTRYVRSRGDIAIEAAVHALTGRQAELLGIGDRGVLAPGKAADITIFALDELAYGPQKRVLDQPGGRPRLTRDPGGYRYTIVGGVIVQQDGAATGALPARWLARAA
jgi:N-acyl-D-aspartate/D-glutamate deacylase